MDNNLAGRLEAVLFIYGEPLEVKKIAKILGADEESVKTALRELNEVYRAENRGLHLIFSDNRVQIATKPEFGKLIQGFIKEEFQETLTPAALETLAIILYAAPIPRSVIDYIRGVNSSFILRALLLRGLVERANDPQKPQTYIYKPSFELLRHLGVSEIQELPDYQRFREIVQKLMSPA